MATKLLARDFGLSMRLSPLALAAALSKMPLRTFVRLHALHPWLGAFVRPDVELLRWGPDWLGRPEKTLRLCECCLKEDLSFRGFSYWRRSHQLIGVTWCTKHERPLLQTSLSSAMACSPKRAASLYSAGRLPAPKSVLQRRYADIALGMLEQFPAASAQTLRNLVFDRARQVQTASGFYGLDCHLLRSAERWVGQEQVYGSWGSLAAPGGVTMGAKCSDAPALTYTAAAFFGSADDAIRTLNSGQARVPVVSTSPATT